MKHVVLFFVVASLGCDGPREESWQTRTSAVVYGDDDREELFAVDDVRLLERARSVAALVRSAHVSQVDDAVTLNAPSLARAARLCDGATFGDQPAPSFCTGSLIDDNLLLTAGHCVRDDTCADTLVVFGYRYTAPGVLAELTKRDVYRCKRVIARALPEADAETTLDFEILELDRVVEGRPTTPLADVRLAPGDELAVISTPAGVPLKLDRGGAVRDARDQQRDYFVLDSDTFEGSSGAPVFDADANQVGVFVRGNPDYSYDAPTRCAVPVVLDPESYGEGGMPAEEATYSQRAVDALCATGHPSVRLCGTLPEAEPTDASATACALTRSSRRHSGTLIAALLALVGLWRFFVRGWARSNQGT